MGKEELEQRAFALFHGGFHCAEAVAKAVTDEFADEPSVEIPRIATGFGGGIGRSHEDTCGALSGGVVALGYLHGRMKQGENIDDFMGLVAKFRSRFMAEAGASNCHDLLKGFGEQKNLDKCKGLTAKTAGILWDILSSRDVACTNVRSIK